jgi:hypothetical protein
MFLEESHVVTLQNPGLVCLALLVASSAWLLRGSCSHSCSDKVWRGSLFPEKHILS